MKHLQLLILLLPSIALAAPGDLVVNQSITHGGTISISGTGFGTKSPAAPLVWDSGASDVGMSTYYDAYQPTAAQQGSAYNIQYREVGYRDVEGPHDRANYYITGAHAMNEADDTFTRGGTVAFGLNMTSQEYYISYYYRVDP